VKRGVASVGAKISILGITRNFRPSIIFRFLWLSLILAPGAWVAPSFAEDPAMVYGFKGYGIEQGLTSPSITAIIQDLDGFLWVGTEDGLFRLEGENFRRFGKEDGLPINSIEALAFARPSGIWVTTAKGIVWWDGKRFLHPSSFGFPAFNDRPGLPLPSGGVILSNFEAKQRFFSPTDGRGFRELKGLPWGGGAYCAFFDPGRNLLLVALQDGLWVWDGQTWESRKIFEDSEKDKAIFSILIDRKGRYWLRQTERLFRLETFDAPLVRVSTPEPLSLVTNSFLAEDEFGRVWTNTAKSLIWLSETGSGVLGEHQGLPAGGAFVFLVDSQGTLWVGGDGVYKLQGDFLWTSATRKDGLPGDVTWSVRRSRAGRIWAGTAGGLAYGTPQGWRLVPGTAQCQIMSLFEDAKGVLWVGYAPGGERTTGLMQVLPGRTEAQSVPIRGSKVEGGIYGIAQGPGDSLWIGAVYSGLMRGFPGPAGMQVEAVEIPGWPAADSTILSIAADGAGGLWVVGNRGAAHWDGHTWAVLAKGTLRDQEMISVLPLGREGAWLAPQNGRQLSRLVREDSHLRLAEILPRAHPLSQAMIYGLGRDAKGVIWVATARGLMRWEGGRVEKYGRNAGLPGEDCAQNALWVDPGGDVWAGLSVGLAHGDMDLRHAPQLPPAVTILECKDGEGRLLSASGPAPKIPWQARTMFFRYIRRGSKWTEGTGFQVRLVGLEDAWRNTDISEALYPGLAAGHYRFEVRTVSATLEYGKTESAAFQILAPWWRRWWAEVIWALILCGLAFLVYHRRTAILRRRNEFLEALVQARTGELEQANEALREAILIDPLTGLYNRRFLTMTMPEEEVRLRRMFRSYIQKGESPLNHNEDLVLFLGDLDHFKRINDAYGHAAGDQVIQEAAQALRVASRTADTLVRWGGEEFLLVAKRSDREKAHLIAEKLCHALRDHSVVLPDGRRLRCTISIGFAVFPILDQNPEAFTWEDTLQVADQCLYAVKRAGRDGWVGVHTLGPLDSVELAPRLRVDLEGLVREGHVHVRSSFPEGKAFAIPDITSGLG
jgi:diguanylate cyclase (GGDEF)-like protein